MNKVLLVLILSFVGFGCSHSPKHDHHHKAHHGAHKAKATKHGHAHHGALRHDFSDAQKWSKMFDDPKRNTWQKPQEVTNLMAIQPGMVVADVGAGTGFFLPHLDKAVGAGGKVLALDIEKTLVAHMNKRVIRQELKSTSPGLIASDDPQLSPQSVDRILIVDTWHHIQGRKAYAQKLKKSLKKGGQVVIVDFEPDAKGPGPKKKHRLSVQAIQKELESGGLKTKILKESLPYQYIVVGFL